MNDTQTLPRTTILVNERLPKDLANIVLGYFKSTKRDWESISIIGEYETCLQILGSKLDICIQGACIGGHIELVNFMISKGANNWNACLYAACRGGHVEIVNLMISKGATSWNYGLYGACQGGHMEIAQLMISKGATSRNLGFYGARAGGHTKLADLMILKGANVVETTTVPGVI